jgi:hypothetical protein
LESSFTQLPERNKSLDLFGSGFSLYFEVMLVASEAFYMMAEGLCDEPDFSTFENKTGLAEDMKFLASMPELCDITFLVGDTREPVCAVKAVLAARSR